MGKIRGHDPAIGKTIARLIEIQHNGHHIVFEETWPGKFTIRVSGTDGKGFHTQIVRMSRQELDGALSKAGQSKEQNLTITVPAPIPGATRESKMNRTETIQIPCDKVRLGLKRLDSLPPR